MAWNPAVCHEYQRIASTWGVGSGASPLILGASEEYLNLSLALSSWHQCDSALVFPSGYAANFGTLAALARPEDLILSDSLNHACLIDGCRISKATLKIYPHCNLNALDQLLKKHRSEFRMAFIVTDSLFSMDGDLAPMAQIDSLCGQYDAIGLVDEAHAAGVLGPQGQGLLRQAQCDPSRWVKTGTLSKAVGCSGGYVVGSQLLCETLLHRARPLVFSTALPPAVLGAAAKSIEILQNMDAQRHSLLELSNYLRREVQNLGLRTRLDTSPILPVYVDDPHQAIELSTRLLQEGIYVPAIRPPTVPADRCLLRISLNAAHTPQDCQRLLDTLKRIKSSSK
jgi:8-amino-7-oxononanoate synthase